MSEPEREPVEQLRDLAEEARVRWILMDAQQKQVILLAGLYALYTLFDVVGTMLKARIGGKA